MTSGYQYLKEKVARLEAEVIKKDKNIEKLEGEIEQLEKELEAIQDEHSEVAFNRMVKGVRELTGWQRKK